MICKTHQEYTPTSQELLIGCCRSNNMTGLFKKKRFQNNFYKINLESCSKSPTFSDGKSSHYSKFRILPIAEIGTPFGSYRTMVHKIKKPKKQMYKLYLTLAKMTLKIIKLTNKRDRYMARRK